MKSRLAVAITHVTTRHGGACGMPSTVACIKNHTLPAECAGPETEFESRFLCTLSRGRVALSPSSRESRAGYKRRESGHEGLSKHIGMRWIHVARNVQLLVSCPLPICAWRPSLSIEYPRGGRLHDHRNLCCRRRHWTMRRTRCARSLEQPHSRDAGPAPHGSTGP